MIEKTDKVPLPEGAEAAPRGPTIIYPYRAMEIGDSFRIEGKKVTDLGMSQWRKVTGFKFIARTRYDEDGTRYVRIWRTS